jgi:hypothetical protein
MSRARDRADGDFAGKELIFDADGDTSITADTDDQIDIKIAGSDQIKIAAGEVAFNEASGDIDFRVESNGQTHMLFVDGGVNQVGVGVVPNDGWNTNFLGIDINNQGGIHHYTSADLTVENNAYFDSSNAWRYKRDGFASSLNFVNASGNVKFQSAASGSADGAISFLDNIEMEHSSGDLKVTRGDIFFGGSGKGINLGVTSNTDSNTLDDYEEGTFTFGTNANIGLNSSSNVGNYTKIGRIVHIQLMMDLSSVSSTNHVYISGMPFTSVAHTSGAYNGNAFGSVSLYNVNFDDNANFTYAVLGAGSTNVYIYHSKDNANWDVMVNSELTSSAEIGLSLTYVAG